MNSKVCCKCKIRGILCHFCNRALGLFQDDIDALKNAIKYLEKEKL